MPRAKNGDARYIPLNHAAIAALRILETSKNDSAYAIHNAKGARLNSPRFWFEAVVEKAKLRISLGTVSATRLLADW